MRSAHSTLSKIIHYSLFIINLFFVSSVFAKTAADYIQNGLIVQYDAIENAGNLTFNPNAVTWKNLAGNNDAAIVNASANCWSGKSLVMDGSLYASFDADFGRLFTVEIACDTPLADVTANYATYFSSSDGDYAVTRWGKTATYLYFTQPVLSKYPLYSYNNKGVDLIFDEANVTIVAHGESPRNDAVKAGDAVATGLRTWLIGGTDASHALNGHVYSLRVYNRALSLVERQANAKVDDVRFRRGDYLLKNYVNVINSCEGLPDEIIATPSIGTHQLTPGVEMSFSVNKTSYTSGTETGTFKGWTLTTIRGGQKTVTSGESTTCSFTPQADDVVQLVWNWDRSDAYRWIATTSQKWNITASAWADGAIPPNDIYSAEVIYPAIGGSGNYYSQGSSQSMKKMTVTPPPSSVHNQFVGFQHEVHLGSGGISMCDTVGRTYVYFQHLVEAACDQVWNLDATVNNVNGVTIYRELAIPEDVTLTLAGRRSGMSFTGGNGTYCKGRIRTNGNFSFNSLARLAALGTAGIFWTNDELDGYPVYTNANGKVALTFNCAIADEREVNFSNDFEFAFTNSNYSVMPWHFDRSNAYPIPIDFKVTIDGKWSGVISNGLVNFTWKRLSDSTTTLPDPFQVGRIVFDMDGSNLSTNGYPCIRYHYGVYEVANDNALGVSNRLGAVFGSTASADPQPTGTAVAYIAAPGVTINGDIRTSFDDLPLNNGYLYNVHGFQIYLGAFDPGEVWYTGDIANRDSLWKKNNNGYTYCPPDQFRLTAVKGATAHFSGALSGGKAFPYEIHGAGTVELSGDNSAMVCGLSVRGGNLELASAASAGTQPLSLGGSVPSVADVELFTSNFGGSSNPFKAEWTADGTTSFTKKDGTPIVFDGVEMQVGERVYICSDIPGGPHAIYRMTSATVIEKDTDVTFAIGQRIRIAKGEKYGGTAKMMLRSNNGGTDSGTWEPSEPDVALMLKNGITVTNDITVTDNKSTGTSTIGVTDVTENTLSGTITLNKDIEFDVAPGGNLKLTGSIVDDGDHNVKLVNSGTVEFPAAFDWSGRSLDLSGLTDAVFIDAPRTLVLATGSNINSASVTYPPNNGRYRVKVTAGRVTASKAGLTLMVR